MAQPWEGPERLPMRLMTDTPEYCSFLAARVANMQHSIPEPSPDARMLAMQGRRMCEQGLIHAGIRRMRQAIMILRTQR